MPIIEKNDRGRIVKCILTSDEARILGSKNPRGAPGKPRRMSLTPEEINLIKKYRKGLKSELLQYTVTNEVTKETHQRKIRDDGELQQMRHGAARELKGEICELVVATDLSRRGAIVFKHVFRQSPCDLIALINGKFIRVEVKYGNGYAGYQKDNHDIVARVGDNGIVNYYDINSNSISSLKEYIAIMI